MLIKDENIYNMLYIIKMSLIYYYYIEGGGIIFDYFPL